jgi:hypothetical protein
LRAACRRGSFAPQKSGEEGMNDQRAVGTAPGWFTITAIGALLWEMLGCGLFLATVLTDPAGLPIDQRAAILATPTWMNAAWSFAVLVGLVGAVLLLMKNRKSEPLLLLSFLATLVQFSGMFLVPQLRNLVESDDLFIPFVVAVICYGIWHLARHARREGWLR